MPRSANKNWSSERRLEYIEDQLATRGHFQRDDICNYFSCIMSIASGDIAEYVKRGGRIHIRTGFIEADGSFRKDSVRNQAKKYFFPDADHKPVLNTTPERQAAWTAIHAPARNMKFWQIDRRLDWIDDMLALGRVVTPEGITAYFGAGSDAVGTLRDYNALPGTDGRKRRSTEARRAAWEVWG